MVIHTRSAIINGYDETKIKECEYESMKYLKENCEDLGKLDDVEVSHMDSE